MTTTNRQANREYRLARAEADKYGYVDTVDALDAAHRDTSGDTLSATVSAIRATIETRRNRDLAHVYAASVEANKEETVRTNYALTSGKWEDKTNRTHPKLNGKLIIKTRTLSSIAGERRRRDNAIQCRIDAERAEHRAYTARK